MSRSQSIDFFNKSQRRDLLAIYIVNIVALIIGRLLLGATLGFVIWDFIASSFVVIARPASRRVMIRVFAILIHTLIFALFLCNFSHIGQIISCTCVAFISFLMLVVIADAVARYSPRSFAECTTTLIWILYLGWPICFARAWVTVPGSRLLDSLANINPLLVLNGIYPELGDWSHRPIAYSTLMNLGQDVPYVLPRGLWPILIAESGVVIFIAIILLLINTAQQIAPKCYVMGEAR